MAARVLVVEDDPTVTEVLSAYLARAGYEVAASGDGSEALGSGHGSPRTW